jgi:hypothetical protein
LRFANTLASNTFSRQRTNGEAYQAAGNGSADKPFPVCKYFWISRSCIKSGHFKLNAYHSKHRNATNLPHDRTDSCKSWPLSLFVSETQLSVSSDSGRTKYYLEKSTSRLTATA